MSAELHDGKLTVDVGSLLDCMSGEQLRDLIDRLACQDEVIRYVVDQILEGETEQRSYASRSFPAESAPRHALDEAHRRIAKGASDVAKAEIERLERAVKALEATIFLRQGRGSQR